MGDHVMDNDKISQHNHIHKLLHAESPFRWKPEILEENRYEIDVELQEKDEFSFQNFVVKIVKSYKEFKKNNVSKALNIVECVNDNLEYLRENKYSDTLFDKIGDALDHVILTCKAYLLVHSNETQEITKVLDLIKPIEEMNKSNKAALHAIRSNVYSLFSYEGTRSAVSCINIAIDLDPEVPYWLFLKGLYLQKMRHLQNLNDAPPLEERALFESAYKKEPDNALFMVYAADIYREHAAHASKKKDACFWFLPDNNSKTDLTNRIENKYKTSLELYKKSYELKPACPVVSFHCAHGLMSLPQKFQDTKLAKTIITTNSPKYPNSGLGNLTSAFYYRKYGKNLHLARRYLEKCLELNIFKGYMNTIIVEYLERREDYDAIGMLTKMLNIFQESPKHGIILSQIVSYHIFVNFDLRKACENTLQYFKSHPQGNCLQVHKSCFIRMVEPISLIDVVTDEVKIALNNPKITPETRKFFSAFVHDMNFQNIKVLTGKPQNLRQLVLKNEKLPRVNRNQTLPTTNFKRRQNMKRFPENQNNFQRAKNFSKSGDAAGSRNVPEHRGPPKPKELRAATNADEQKSVPKPSGDRVGRPADELDRNLKPPLNQNDEKRKSEKADQNPMDGLENFFKEWKLREKNDDRARSSNPAIRSTRDWNAYEKREKDEFADRCSEELLKQAQDHKKERKERIRKSDDSDTDKRSSRIQTKLHSSIKRNSRKSPERKTILHHERERSYHKSEHRKRDRDRRRSPKYTKYTSSSESSSESVEQDCRRSNSSSRRRHGKSSRSARRDNQSKSRCARHEQGCKSHRRYSSSSSSYSSTSSSTSSSESSRDRHRRLHRRRNPIERYSDVKTRKNKPRSDSHTRSREKIESMEKQKKKSEMKKELLRESDTNIYSS